MKKNTLTPIARRQYLTERGYDASSLTEKQQELIYTYLRSSQSSRLGIIAITLMLLMLAATTFYGFKNTREMTAFINDKNVIFYAMVTEGDDRIVEPKQVKQLADKIAEMGTINGARLATTGFLLSLVLTAIFQNRDRRKVLAAFLPQDNTTPPDKES